MKPYQTDQNQTCERCTSPAKFIVRSLLTAAVWTCPVHLADRVTYALGRAVRVDVQKIEVAA